MLDILAKRVAAGYGLRLFRVTSPYDEDLGPIPGGIDGVDVAEIVRGNDPENIFR